MTVKEARKIIKDFSGQITRYTEEDFFIFTEAMGYLIREEHRPEDMMYLGGVYYDMRQFDLALKYYEMAATYEYEEAFECLGYIWYYGRTGTVDYKKAYEYYSRAYEMGNYVATYKLADMYKNGYYVKKNEKTYISMIESLYTVLEWNENPIDPIPEVYTRLARIRKNQEKTEEAIELYMKAKHYLAIRLRFNDFFGNLNIMKWLVNDLYELKEFDNLNMDLYDLYYLLKTPHTVWMFYEHKEIEIKSVMEGSECVINFNGKWFHSIDDFFKEAVIDDIKITCLYDKLKLILVMD